MLGVQPGCFRTIASRSLQQEGHDVGGGVDLCAVTRPFVEEQVGHLGPGMMAFGVADPGVQPVAEIGVVGVAFELLVYIGQIGAEIGLGQRHVVVAVARQAAPLDECGLATLGVRLEVRMGVVEFQGLGFRCQIAGDGPQFDRLQTRGHFVMLVRQVEELGHAGVGPKAAGLFGPVLNPVGVGLSADVCQCGADFPHLTGNLGWIGGGRGAGFGSRRFQTQVGSDLSQAVVAADFVAAKTSVFFDQLEAFVHLGRRGTVLGIDSQFHNVVVTLQTGRLDEPVGLHRVFPEVVVMVVVFLGPLLSLKRVVRRVFAVLEAGAGAVAVVADGAAEFFDGVRTGSCGIDVGAGMAGEGMRIGIGGDPVFDVVGLGVPEGQGGQFAVGPVGVDMAGATAVEPRRLGHTQGDHQVGQPVLTDRQVRVEAVDDRPFHHLAFDG